MAERPDRCTVSTCERPVVTIVPGDLDHGAEMWEVDAFTDAAGNVMTPPTARLAASGWPSCDQHGAAVGWWMRADEATRERVRAADYYSTCAVPLEHVSSFTHAHLGTSAAWWMSAQPGPDGFHLLAAASDALRALDVGEPVE